MAFLNFECMRKLFKKKIEIFCRQFEYEYNDNLTVKNFVNKKYILRSVSFLKITIFPKTITRTNIISLRP